MGKLGLADGDRQASLARAPDGGDGDQPVGGEQLTNLRNFVVTSDQPGWPGGQVRECGLDDTELRERALADLEQVHRFVDVAELMHAEIGCLDASGRPYRSGDQYLSTVPRCLHSGGGVHDRAEVVTSSLLSFAEMESHPDPQRGTVAPRCETELLLGLGGCGYAIGGPGKGRRE